MPGVRGANAKVAVVDVNGEGALAVTASIGAAATAHTTDVTDGAQVAAVAEAVLAERDRVDVLVNDVGHWVNVRPFQLSGPDLGQGARGESLTQVFSVTQAFLGQMIGRGKGVVVAFASEQFRFVTGAVEVA